MLGLVYHSYNEKVIVEIYERNPKIMDDRKVGPVVQELPKNEYSDILSIIGEGKQDNDGIEEFNTNHDDVDWYEWVYFPVDSTISMGIFLFKHLFFRPKRYIIRHKLCKLKEMNFDAS